MKKLVAVALSAIILSLLLPPLSAQAEDPIEPLELINLRTDNSKTFLLESGEYQTAFFNIPVHYQDSGQWEEIETAIVPSDRANWDWEVTKGLWQLLIREDTSVALGRDGHWVGFRLDGIAYLDSVTKEYEILQTRQPVAPNITGNSIRWENILHGVNLEYTYIENRFQEKIEVTQVARDWATAHPPSDYGLSNQNSYLTFFMFCDWKDAHPAENQDGSPINWANAWDSDNKSISFRHKIKNYVVAMLPVSYATSENDTYSEAIPIKKRFFSKNDNHWLLRSPVV